MFSICSRIHFGVKINKRIYQCYFYWKTSKHLICYLKNNKKHHPIISLHLSFFIKLVSNFQQTQTTTPWILNNELTKSHPTIFPRNQTDQPMLLAVKMESTCFAQNFQANKSSLIFYKLRSYVREQKNLFLAL